MGLPHERNLRCIRSLESIQTYSCLISIKLDNGIIQKMFNFPS